MVSKIKKWLPSKRKLIQLYFALLFNANVKGFVSGTLYKGSTKAFCVPGLNCYSCPGAVGACPLGSLQGAFSAGHSTVFYVCGIVLLYGFLLGRMICGWLCPFGLIQEWLHKIPTPKLKKGPATRLLSWLKYVILVIFVGIIPIAYAFRDTPLPAFCKYICPAGTLEGGMGLLSNAVNGSYFSMLGPLFTWKFLLMVSILTSCVFIFRLFCRFICPLGALYGLFNKLSIFGIKAEQDKCVGCGKCISHCKMDIRHAGDRECIGCGECIEICPTQAIRFKGGKVLLKENEGQSDRRQKRPTVTRTIVAILMTSLLIGAFAWYWVDDTGAGTTQGSKVGDLCYGQNLEIITAQGLSGETVNPAGTGKITIINFWGTWCTPCVSELPYFDQIAADYADTVEVIAIHTHMVHETAPAFLETYYPDSRITFAKDQSENNLELYYNALGGRGTYPYTLILDEQGIIRNIFLDPLDYEDLQQAVETLLNP